MEEISAAVILFLGCLHQQRLRQIILGNLVIFFPGISFLEPFRGNENMSKGSNFRIIAIKIPGNHSFFFVIYYHLLSIFSSFNLQPPVRFPWSQRLDSLANRWWLIDNYESWYVITILYLRHASFNHLESHACPSQSSSFLRLLVNELWELLLTLGCLALRRWVVKKSLDSGWDTARIKEESQPLHEPPSSDCP